MLRAGQTVGFWSRRREDVFRPVQPAGTWRESQGTNFKPDGVEGAALVPVTLTP